MGNQAQVKHKSWFNQKPSYRSQNVNYIVSFFGVIISITLSGWAVYLTHRYGESTTQINTLTRIASKQQVQIDQLKSILNESRIQTNLSSQQVDKLTTTNDRLVGQSGLLSQQLKLVSIEQTDTKRSRNLSRHEELIKLKNTAEFLVWGTIPGFKKNNPDSTSRKIAINQIERLLESELTNHYLLDNKKLANEWQKAYSNARATAEVAFGKQIIMQRQIDGRFLPMTENQAQIEQLDTFNKFIDFFKRFSDKFWTNLLLDDEFKSLVQQTQ